MTSPWTSRSLAIDALMAVLVNGQHADSALAERLHLLASVSDRRFLHVLAYGVLRHVFSLEADVSRYIRRKPDDAVRCALLLGTLQLRHLDTPDHAAVGETVEAVRQFCPQACRMVNAVLRRVASSSAPKRLKPHQRLDIPQWMYRRWRDEWGQECLQQMSQHLGSPAPLTLAVHGHREDWLQQVNVLGLQAKAGEHTAHSVLLPTGTAVEQLPGFAQGECWVMDQAAQASVQLLLDGVDASSLKHVLDVCAAPGGKTAMLAQLLPHSHITAIEYSASRLPLLQHNLQRMQWISASLLRADGMHLPFADHSVDALFVDAPCSASGLLRKHPDVRFLHDEQQLVELLNRQQRLLNEAFRVLQSGGCMVYAVCSIHRAEQQPPLPDGLSTEDELRVFPDAERDGFYAARLRKS